jgi:hypothetical protein
MTHCLFYHPRRARGVRSRSDCIVIDGAAAGKVILTGGLPVAQSEAGVRPVGGIAGERWRAGRDRRGVDATEQGETPGESLEEIAVHAAMAVLADGRIEKSSVDGLITRKSPLITRVVMTPYVASATTQVRPESRRGVGGKAAQVLRGSWPLSCEPIRATALRTAA